ncbi:hypothetical protein INT47_002515 [Mucor saturninus]|uniref:Uncharacterized protein n=1 Tax=Mucor saturninus TaxID=64648 RepID=A0A8H7RH98_9FUNG|nr:hypothetical protein INT47_002515 [Mucor saturninus]
MSSTKTSRAKSPNNIKGVSKEYLKAPVSCWTSPKKLVDAIDIDNIFQTTPPQALNHIRNSLETIGKSASVSNQLSRYAIKCHDYSLKPKFKETFERLYAAKRGRAQDSLLNKQSSALYFKAINSAADITDKALDIVKESTMEIMNAPGHSTISDSGQNNLKDMKASNIDNEESMSPARTINHSPNQPKLPITHIESTEKQYFIGISSAPLSSMPNFLRETLNHNHADQKALRSLNNFPNTLQIIKYMMEDDVDKNTFPQILWSFQTQAMTWSCIERGLFSTFAIIMTDFWGLYMRQNFNRDHERTFWVEYVVPIFKHFTIINKEIVFSWCESKVLSHSNSQMVPGVWNNTTEKLFADGIGRENGFEVIIMESSGPHSTEHIDHSMGDTQKLITMASNSLRDEILKYQDASFDTAKNLSVYSIQCIRDKITLIKTSLYNPSIWQIVELRSATILVTWDARVNMVAIFELLATLQASS